MKITQIAPNAFRIEPLIRPVLDLYETIPGKKRIQDKKILVEASRENIQFLLEKVPSLAVAGLPSIDDYLGVNFDEPVIPPSEVRAGYAFKTKPYDHQAAAFSASRHREYFALFMEMGTGKTWVFLNTGFSLFHEGHIDCMLVMAPIGVHQQWVDEQLPLHAPDEIQWTALAWSKKLLKTEGAPKLSAILKPSKSFRIMTVGYENLASEHTRRNVLAFAKSGRCLVVYDESHKLKNQKAQRTKFAAEVAGHCIYRRIGTGTEVTEGAEDLFSQMQILKEGMLGPKSFRGFMAEYCETKPVEGAPRGVVRVIGYKSLDRLRARIAPHAFYALKKDCLDLPEKVYMTRSVPLTDEQRSAYGQAKRDMLVLLQNTETEELDEATITHAATLVLRLQQITSGHLKTDDGKILELDTNRIEAVLDILSESKTAIIWARFVNDIQRLRAALKAKGYRVGCYYGSTTTEERLEITKPGAVDVLICNQQSAAAGLNLTHFTTSIYYSNSFNASDRWQSEDRIHRIGQRSNCTYVDLISPGTVDSKIVRALRSKKNVADMIRSGKSAVLDLLSEE